jgi:hypothetical protein
MRGLSALTGAGEYGQAADPAAGEEQPTQEHQAPHQLPTRIRLFAPGLLCRLFSRSFRLLCRFFRFQHLRQRRFRRCDSLAGAIETAGRFEQPQMGVQNGSSANIKVYCTSYRT